MTCPNCGAIFDEGCRFCGACGTPLSIEKKGSHRAPLVILLVLSIIGTSIFFATGGKLVADAPTLPQIDRNYGQTFIVFEGAVTGDYGSFAGQSEITVPETVDGQTITAINSYGFADFVGTTAIHLPDTVTEIRQGAFDSCYALRGMELPPALKRIGDQAFFDCASLEAIHIPATVEHIGQDAFLGCDSLTYIFYDGTIAQWRELCQQELPAETAICCADGTFFQAD